MRSHQPWQLMGKVSQYSGKGRPATLPKPDKDWQYLQAVKKRKGSRLVSVHIKVVFGDPEEVKAMVGSHTAYIERSNLISRRMNGRLVRKTLSFSKELRFLEAASRWEVALYNFTRPVKTLRLEREVVQHQHTGGNEHRLWLLTSPIIFGPSRSF